MNPPANKPPNYADIVQDILKSVNGPIAVKDLAALILQARPSQTKNPHEAALVKIREEQGRQLVYFDESVQAPPRESVVLDSLFRTTDSACSCTC